ncbi:hypothetical protein [Litorilituus lipolyticus]|uniref:Uncharacterized protein n=1 Tax=Litorilituus lipolyticus TaxID=2491017 RepID=A0A502KLQ7_9GAMM|nr:hypothetical protein [Litorilituus lipolyticus]TPH12560.1 hypothetical protein EPA86_16600 [Litorilituus lipolyticus]
MTKLESIAVAILVIASGAYIINSVNNSDENTVKKQETSTTVSTQAKKPVNQSSQPLPPPRHNTSVNHAALPVEHGYADDSGKQINPETGERLPPPPPAPAPRKNGNRTSHHSAHQHGHESDSSNKRGSDVPPPVGPNG